MIILILPNYGQSDQISVLRGTGSGQRYSWKLAPYRDAVSSLKMPLSWARGIPAPVAARETEPDFVLAQLVNAESGHKIWTFAIRAGKDVSGRDVFLTLITDEACLEVETSEYILGALDAAEKAQLDDDAGHRLVPSERRALFDTSVSAILYRHRPNSPKNWYLARACITEKTHYANVSFEGMSYLPDSQKVERRLGLLLERLDEASSRTKAKITAGLVVAGLAVAGAAVVAIAGDRSQHENNEPTPDAGKRANELAAPTAHHDEGDRKMPTSQ